MKPLSHCSWWTSLARVNLVPPIKLKILGSQLSQEVALLQVSWPQSRCPRNLGLHRVSSFESTRNGSIAHCLYHCRHSLGHHPCEHKRPEIWILVFVVHSFQWATELWLSNRRASFAYRLPEWLENYKAINLNVTVLWAAKGLENWQIQKFP